MHTVSRLPCLKIFHFPQQSHSFDDWSLKMGGNIKKGNIKKWPDSLETFHIPCGLLGYLDAIAMAPASLKSLIIDEDAITEPRRIDEIFDRLGPQILNLSVHYHDEPPVQLAQMFTKLPNLLHLSTDPWILLNQEENPLELRSDHPLCSITLNSGVLGDLFSPDLLRNVKNFLHNPRLPNIQNLLLSGKWSGEEGRSWVDYLRRCPLPKTHVEFFEMSKFLQQRIVSSSGLKKNGVWLVDGERDPQENNDFEDIVCEFSEGEIARIKSGELNGYGVRSEDIVGDGGGFKLHKSHHLSRMYRKTCKC
jgi:hypothetical protein